MIKELGKWALKNTPSIISGLAVVGVVATAVAASKDSLRAKEILDDLPDDAEPVDRVKAFSMAYIRTFIVAAGTIGAIVMSDKMHLSKEAAALTELGICKIAASSYKEESKKLFGEKEAKRLEDAVSKDFVKQKPPMFLDVAKYYAQEGKKPLCLFRETGAYFIATMEEIEAARKELCKTITYKEGYASVGDFEDLMGMEPSDIGYRNGWWKKGVVEDDEVQFGYTTTLLSDVPVLVVTCETEPHEYYSDRET